jgi:hypothetical protein
MYQAPTRITVTQQEKGQGYVVFAETGYGDQYHVLATSATHAGKIARRIVQQSCGDPRVSDPARKVLRLARLWIRYCWSTGWAP